MSYFLNLIVVPLFSALLYLLVGVWNLPANFKESSIYCYFKGIQVKSDEQYKDYKSVI